MSIQSLGKTNNIVLPSKSSQGEKVKNTNNQDDSSIKSNIEITTAGQEITKSLESLTPPVNQERVDAIKQSLSDGSYSIDAEKIAEKMIQMDQ